MLGLPGAVMSFEEGLVVTQERLSREAGSLGELLARLRGHVSSVLIGDREWEHLLERARQLPVTMAALPFGFELPLHERRPGADLGVSVVGGTGSAAYFEDMVRSGNEDPVISGIVRLLHETERDDSPLGQVIGRKMMLEYDVRSAPGGTHPAPGIFLRPAQRPIMGAGDDERIQDIGVVLAALASAVGWSVDAAERRLTEQVHLAQPADTRIDSFGAFPARDRAIRLAVTGFRSLHDIAVFLERAGWRGGTVLSAASSLEQRGGFVSLGVHIDVRADGLGPSLGLSFAAKHRAANDPGYWLDRPDQWTTFINGLRQEEELAVPEKLEALAAWSPGPTTLFGASGAFVLVRGIHHVKLVLVGDRIAQVKAYPFMAMTAAPPS